MAATNCSAARATNRTHRRILREYLAFAYFHGITELTSVGAIMVYLQHLKNMGLQSRTICNYMSALKTQLARGGL